MSHSELPIFAFRGEPRIAIEYLSKLCNEFASGIWLGESASTELDESESRAKAFEQPSPRPSAFAGRAPSEAQAPSEWRRYLNS